MKAAANAIGLHRRALIFTVALAAGTKGDRIVVLESPKIKPASGCFFVAVWPKELLEPVTQSKETTDSQRD